MRELKVFDPKKIHFHPTAEKIAQHLCGHCENDSPTFFRVITSYFLGKVASQMRATIKTHNSKNLPINIYGVGLCPSGAGKTKAMNFMEEDICSLFNERFAEELLPYAAEKNLNKLAVQRGRKKGTDPDEELKELVIEFKASGQWLSSFDSATVAAIKQFRHKVLLAGAGALNLEIDEVGSNLTGNKDAFSKYLELYDKGYIKESLVKNTKENVRMSEIKGATPSNLIMFGTPSSLLDGSKTEQEFYDMLEEGYARRCIFGFTRDVNRNLKMSAEEIYDRNMNQQSHQFIEDFAEKLMKLADPINFKREIKLDKNEELLRIEYMIYCQDRSAKLSEFDIVKKIELDHRWFKALKLAAAYAFIDSSPRITENHLYNAIAVVEDSGLSFNKLLTRDRPYVKLAKYLGGVPRHVTQVELVEDLPFYKGHNAQKAEMMTMAIAYGYQNNIIIKKMYADGIEFFKGESLQETNTEELTAAYSDHVAYNYFNDTVTWNNLNKLVQMPDMHWVSHHMDKGHRCDENAIAGFNLLIIDVDGDAPLDAVRILLKDYKSIIYTTKRHGVDGEDRYRIVMPMKYILKLDGPDYKEFMAAVYEWLPFKVDDQTNQRSRKWLANPGDVYDNEGEMFDPLSFIPKTTKNEKRKERLLDQQSLTNLERWFINNTGMGNRSNQLIKYALVLVDSGKTLIQTEQAVFVLNEKLADGLPEEEISTTIMQSARKAYAKLAA